MEAQNKPAKISIHSSAFNDHGAIPSKFTGDGADVSPPLEWSGAPVTTKEFLLIVDDPDAPTARPWVHWVVFKIPGTTTRLTEGWKSGLSGVNSWVEEGYRGPAPPKGKSHRYFFKLYALDTELSLKRGVTKELLEQATVGHVVGYGELVGTYQR